MEIRKLAREEWPAQLLFPSDDALIFRLRVVLGD